MNRKYTLAAVISACIFGIILSAAVVMLWLRVNIGGIEAVSRAAKYAAVAEIIDKRYVGDSDPDEVCDAAISGMIASLGDQWSYYMTAEQYESYKQYVKNVYTGIGISIRRSEDEDGLLIMSVTPGGPAEAAGVEAGDILIGVDGEDVKSMEVSEVKSIIQSKNGQTVVLQLIRKGGEAEEVSVTCGEIKVETVSFEMLEDSIGYIKIANFEDGCSEGAISAVDELVGNGAGAIIFDVRSNPGGKVSELTKLLDYLLPEGDIFVSVSEDGVETVTRSDDNCIELPMAVLVNADSYSAAELFAATLSEYGWAETVGEATTGKGRSQVTLVLRDGSAVHLSTNAYLTPNRVDLSETGGIVPVHEIALSDENDNQLEQAKKILS